MERTKFLENDKFPVEVFKTETGRKYAQSYLDHYFNEYIAPKIFYTNFTEETEDRLKTLAEAEATMQKYISYYDSLLYQSLYGDSPSEDDSSSD